jgi:hypothetical protein
MFLAQPRRQRSFAPGSVARMLDRMTEPRVTDEAGSPLSIPS